MEIKQLTDNAEKCNVTRLILEALPEWFGIPEAREEYITESADKLFFCACDKDCPIGFLYLKETGNATVELYVMGVLKEFHRQGIGRALFHQAQKTACEAGYTFMQVKTVQMGRYEEYDRTNQFYLSLGFKEFEVFPTLWDEWNPCQIYIMSLL
jgi:GNAT superfamily N-acetyltransferase